MSGYSLCKICLDCLDCYGTEFAGGGEIDALSFDHHPSLRSLQESAQSNCPICTIMLKQLHVSVGPNTVLDPKLALTTDLQVQPSYRFPADGGFNLSGSIESRYTKFTESQVDFELFREADMMGYYASQNRSTSTDSKDAWSAVSLWLSHCLSSHSECQRDSQPAWYPSRLLDVDIALDDKIKLVITGETIIRGEYLTLSHRWGDAVTVKLNHSTFQDLRSGFLIAGLPLTFRQAVETTRRLGYRYLWIDSLCIVQDEDDKADWLQQAGQMEKIYFHGFLNLAATGSFDSSQGLYRHRDSRVELSPVKVCLPDFVVSQQGQNDTGKDFVLMDWDFLKRELTDAPLNLRAWVLQERLLSHRVLHFGAGQLFWECKRGILCERFPKELPYFMEADLYSIFKQFKVSDYLQTGNNLISDRLGRARGGVYGTDKSRSSDDLGKKKLSSTDHSLWEKTVLAYSQSQLSYHSDRVIAISGIAKAMRNTIETDYVAGMWRQDLEGQLQWRVERTPRQSSFRPRSYRAPSWSWLSVEGTIEAGSFTGGVLWMKILDVSLQFKTRDDTGLIQSGSLTVQGRVRPLKLTNKYVPHTSTVSAALTTTPIVKKSAWARADHALSWDWTVSGHSLVSDVVRDHGTPGGGFLTYLDVPPFRTPLSIAPVQAQQQYQTNLSSTSTSGVKTDASVTDFEDLYMIPIGGPGKIRVPPNVQWDERYPYHHALILRCIDLGGAVYARVGVGVLNTLDHPHMWDVIRPGGLIDRNEEDKRAPEEGRSERREGVVPPCVRMEYDKEGRQEHVILIE